MNKNVKRIFFVLTLITLLATVGAACAADDSNSTSAVDNSVSDATLSDNNAVAAEPAQTTSNDKQVDTKTIEKEDKNLKTATKTVEVNNMDELKTTMNNALIDAENDTYIINLIPGDYHLTSNAIFGNNYYQPTIIINGNNQVFTADTNRGMRFSNRCNNTINQVTISYRLDITIGSLTLNQVNIINEAIFRNYAGCTLTLINSTIARDLQNDGKLIVGDNVTITDGKKIINNGEIISNNGNLVYLYQNIFTAENGILKDITIDKNITNNGNLTLDNVTIDSTITNNGKLIINDNVIIGDNFFYKGNGEIIINDTSKIAPFLSTYNGNYTLINQNINEDKKNNLNLTIVNSTINSIIINNIEGILTLTNTQ